jgi:hypothetical protein
MSYGVKSMDSHLIIISNIKQKVNKKKMMKKSHKLWVTLGLFLISLQSLWASRYLATIEPTAIYANGKAISPSCQAS